MMQAEGIRKGGRYDELNDRGRVTGGWTATGDAVVAFSDAHGRDMVYVPVTTHAGQEGALSFEPGEPVPLTFGSGPEGDPFQCTCRANVRTCIRHR